MPGGGPKKQGPTAQEIETAHQADRLNQDYKEISLPIERRMVARVTDKERGRDTAIGKAVTGATRDIDMAAGPGLANVATRSGGPGSGRVDAALYGVAGARGAAGAKASVGADQQHENTSARNRAALLSLGRGTENAGLSALGASANIAAARSASDLQADLIRRDSVGEVLGTGLGLVSANYYSNKP